MGAIYCALALLGGAIGAGFASGREIVRFFAAHGAMAGVAVLSALASLCALFWLLPAQLERTGTSTLPALCRTRFGERLGRVCSALFALLCAVTGGAMLAACAELAALTLPLHHAYALGFAFSLPVAAVLALLGAAGMALPGAALCALLPALLLRLMALPVGEACFDPAAAPDLPVRALADGAIYGALNAAMLGGALPLLLPLGRAQRRRAIALFGAGFGLLLSLGVAVCRRHLPAVWNQPLPFVSLSRELGTGGYLLVAACLYAAALSTLCAMLAALLRLLSGPHAVRVLMACALCALFALVGFGRLVSGAYPVLGSLCAALLLLLCLPQYVNSSLR